MSLPAGQQRVLDAIAGSLRTAEPELAARFAIFNRLHRSDPAPAGERLTPSRSLGALIAGPVAWLAAVWRRMADRPGDHGRRAWRRVLVLSHVTIAFVVLAVLIGLNSHAAAACSRRSTQATAAALASKESCPTGRGMGLGTVPLGK